MSLAESTIPSPDSPSPRADEMLRAIVEGTASVTGKKFYHSLVRSLASVLDVRYAFIAEYLDSERSRVRVPAFWTGKVVIEDSEYNAEGTICERVAKDGVVCFYPEGAQILFPHEKFLFELGIESYLGIPFFDSCGSLLGHIAVLDVKPMVQETYVMWILKIFASRAGAEMERQRAEAERTLAVTEERHRLARDLHDSVIQSLYSVSLFAEAARRSAHNNNTTALDKNLARLIETAQQSVREIRRVVHEMRPSLLEEKGLVRAVQERLASIESYLPLSTQLAVEGEITLSRRAELHLYQIIQEALNNSWRHSGADSVSIAFRGTKQALILTICDNGRGFNANDAAGMGLNNMRERARLLSASFEIRTAANQGTCIEIRLPYETQII